MYPTNFPSEGTAVRRLMRKHTGRATPLGERQLITADERTRMREKQAAREAQEGGDGLDSSNNNNSKTTPGENNNHNSRRGNVFVFDARTRWMDSMHRSERRTQVSHVHGDVEYEPKSDSYFATPALKAAASTSYTDAERLALRNLAATPQPGAPALFSSAPRNRAASTQPGQNSSNNNNNSIGQSDVLTAQKPFFAVYHERLNRIQTATEQPQRFGSMSLSSSSTMRDNINESTVNRYGVRHAPTMQVSSIQALRGSAATCIHGERTNGVGHFQGFESLNNNVNNNNGELPALKKTRAVKWKQERFDRLDFVEDRRQRVATREEAVLATKHARSLKRVLSPFRDVDSFLRRESGPKLVKDATCRSSSTSLGKWLFDYPVKPNQ